jgi:hypothetical protein
MKIQLKVANGAQYVGASQLHHKLLLKFFAFFERTSSPCHLCPELLIFWCKMFFWKIKINPPPIQDAQANVAK